ncbi:antitoxin VbhA family protein [Caproiciproducens sp.]
MDRIEKIIGEINGTLAIEGMPLTEGDKDMLRRCMNGETSTDEMIKRLIKQYTVIPE